MRVIFIAVIVGILSGPAQAQDKPFCADRAVMVASLERTLKAERQGKRLLQEHSVIEVWEDVRGNWWITQTVQSGKMCVVVGGQKVEQ